MASTLARIGTYLPWVLTDFGARRVPEGERKALWCVRRRKPMPRVGGLTRRLRREGRAYNLHGVLIYFGGDPKGCRGRAESPLLAAIGNNFAVSKSPWWGLTRRLRRGLGLAVPRGAHTFLSMAKEKCAKESQRHGDSRGGLPRFALRPSPALRLCLATRFMAFGHFWR